MGKKIRLQVSDAGIGLEGELNESPTALAIWAALPIKGRANRWGDEIYFTIPVTHQLEETAREVVSFGDIGYWPVGKALCLFFGPTPASEKDEIRAASPVNVVGRIRNAEPELLRKVRDGQRVEVEKANS